MAPINLIALAIVAIVALSSLPVPVNALVADRAQVARHVHGHNAIAKRKRDSSAQCQPSPSSPTPTTIPIPVYVAPVPSTTTSSSSPAASPSTPASSDGQRKWGLAWQHSSAYLANFANLAHVGFIYTWGPDILAEAWNYPNLQRMPMLHDRDQNQTFLQTVHSGYGQYVLGPNEPNQSNTYVSPSDVYNMWMEWINPLAEEGYILVSPACTDSAEGITWYQEFFNLCTPSSGCIVHMIAFHAYTPDPQHTIDYANTLYDTYKMDVMITEFACQDFSGTGSQPDEGQVWDYAGKVKAFVNGTPWLVGAFPFGVVPDSVFQDQGVDTFNELVDGNGNPTALAMFYFNQ